MNLEKYDDELKLYGNDILNSKGMNMEKAFTQHGNTSVYEHSCMVAKYCLWLTYKFNLNVNIRSLIRGSLLHDYFLYDWHVPDKSHRLHGFTHGKVASINAYRDFCINDVEKNMIACHMFPLTLVPPKYKEGYILTIADKLCACFEIYNYYFLSFKKLIYNKNFYLVRCNFSVVVYFMFLLWIQ